MTDSPFRHHENPGSYPTAVAGDVAGIGIALHRLQRWSDYHPEVELTRHGDDLTWYCEPEHVLSLLAEPTSGSVTTVDGRTRLSSVDFGCGVSIRTYVTLTLPPAS